jgi:hypothetical protein
MLLINNMPLVRFIVRRFAPAVLVMAAAAPLAAQEAAAPAAPLPPAGEVQSKLEQWVKTRQLISEERAAWEVEKSTLSGLNEVRLRETEQLDEFVTAAGSRVAEIDEQRSRFAEDEVELKAWRSVMEKEVASLEQQIRPLLPRFPAPLRGKVEEALIRIESSDPDQPLQNRTRDILLVLQAYLEFQNTLTVESDIREIAGARREVEILYLGMSQAWYVDIDGKHSGYGIPADTGWTWTEDNSIAPRVRAAIDIQARRAAPTFVELPLARGSSGTSPETK